MIICHCEVVTDATVAAAVEDGARTLAQVCQATGAGQSCGGCVFSVKQVLCQHGPPGQQPSLLEAARATSQPAYGPAAQ